MRAILLSILLIGCGKQYDVEYIDENKYVGKRFNENDALYIEYYKRWFLEEAERYGALDAVEDDLNKIRFYFAEHIETKESREQSLHIYGICSLYKSGKRRIVFNRRDWYEGSRNFREGLFLHELGHCLEANLHHDDTIVEDDQGFRRPKSLMASHWRFFDTVYPDFREDYLEEFFYKIKGEKH